MLHFDYSLEKIAEIALNSSRGGMQLFNIEDFTRDLLMSSSWFGMFNRDDAELIIPGKHSRLDINYGTSEKKGHATFANLSNFDGLFGMGNMQYEKISHNRFVLSDLNDSNMLKIVHSSYDVKYE